MTRFVQKLFALTGISLALPCFMMGQQPLLHQQTPETGAGTGAASPVLWHLVRYSGVLDPGSASVRTGAAGITFSLYSGPSGGPELWLETQNVSVDGQGHYNALLGAASPNGIPEDLFTSGQARWLGIRVAGEPVETRVPLVSVPYALQAGDALTLGGRSATEYVLSDELKQQIQAELRNQLQAAGLAPPAGNQSSPKQAASVVSAAGGQPSTPGCNSNGGGVTNCDLQTELNQIIAILNTPPPPPPIFKFELCTEPAFNFEVAGKANMVLDGSVVATVGADVYGNGGKLLLRAKPEGGVDTSFKGSWDLLKFGACADLNAVAAARAQSASPTTKSAAAIPSNLLNQIANLDQNAMLTKMLGTADGLQMDPSKLQNLLDRVANLSFDGGPLAALLNNADRAALFSALPVPQGVKTVLSDPSILVAKLKGLLDAGVCNISAQAPALDPLLKPVCDLANDHHFADLLNRVDGVTGGIQNDVSTIKNKVQNVLDLLPGGSNCKIFCS